MSELTWDMVDLAWYIVELSWNMWEQRRLYKSTSTSSLVYTHRSPTFCLLHGNQYIPLQFELAPSPQPWDPLALLFSGEWSSLDLRNKTLDSSGQDPREIYVYPRFCAIILALAASFTPTEKTSARRSHCLSDTARLYWWWMIASICCRQRWTVLIAACVRCRWATFCHRVERSPHLMLPSYWGQGRCDTT